jgi:hypothetical protein
MMWTGLAIGIAILMATGYYIIQANWPYRYRKIKPLLEDVFAGQVVILRYHRTYFPSPGFIATGITLRRKSAPDQPPVGSAETLLVQGNWTDLLMLRERVRLVDITGLHVVIPPAGSRANQEDFPPGSSGDFTGPTTAVEKLAIHKATLDILLNGGGRLSFPIHELIFGNLHKGNTVTYGLDMQNAQPTGRIQATGTFGPLDPNKLGATPVSGNFTFTSVDLHNVGNVHGILSSSGSFRGPLEAINATGTAVAPNFAVDDAQTAPVSASVQCTINGLNGDVTITRVDGKTGSTAVRVAGSVAGSPKIANLDILVPSGRAEDLMRPFIHGKVPIYGPVWLRAHAYVGPSLGGDEFLQRLRVEGVFEVPAERVADRATGKSLSAFSQRAQGQKDSKSNGTNSENNETTEADSLSSISGPARIRNGIVSTEGVTFKVAGAQANLKGDFYLHGQTVHLVGLLKMDSDISHATTGFKSFLLKPFDPFFKKGKKGAVVPIAVTGAPGSYKVTADFDHRK